MPATLPPPSSRYPTFNNTLELTRQLGICPSIETLKTLENVEGKGKEKELEVRLDPRIQKHDLPRGKVQGQTSCAKRQRIIDPDEEIPLEWDEDAGALEWDEQDDVDDPMGLDITAEDLCAAEGMLESGHMVRVETDSKHAQNTDNGFAVTRPSDLGDLVTNNKISCLPLHDELSENEAIWMLDSGASWHFTYNTNNFVELEAITPLPIYTANGQTEITGKGTVIFTVDGCTIRLYPIYYIPDIKTRLLSLGQFLQSGLHLRGSACNITLYQGQEEFLAFHPRRADDTLYIIKTLLGAEITVQFVTIYSIDFEIMHRWLAHPSKDVIIKAKKHIKDFPDVQVPKEHLCPGCEQGKMTNKAFPPSNLRASEPFELMHSDVIAYPIESYKKFKYSIFFYDDYSSHARTINLRTKDAALQLPNTSW